MKIFKKIILSMGLLCSVIASANESSRECLIEDMAQDENVINYIDDLIVLNLSHGYDFSNVEDEDFDVADMYRRVAVRTESAKTLQKSIHEAFPSIEKMNNEEKTAIYQEIAEREEKTLASWSCIRSAFQSFGACAGIAITGWAGAKLWFCLGAFAIADVVEVAEGPVAATAVLAEVETESVWCARLNGVGAALATTCAGDLLVSISGCF